MTKVFLAILLFSLIYTSNAQRAIQISNDQLRVEINTLGAELQSIKTKDNTEYLWQGDPEYWAGRAPLMFPVCVKFKDQEFEYKGKRYEMPDMGLAKISLFKIAIVEKEKVVFELESDENTLKHYPFPFLLRVIYELKGKKLYNWFELENRGDETMYFALGGHPGFRFPFQTERQKNQLVFDAKYDLQRTLIAGGLVQKEQLDWLKNEDALPLDDARIPDAGMFVKDMPSRKIGVGIVGQKKAFVELDLGDFPNCNIWTPPGRPYVCIEPMLGHHDLQETEIDITKKSYLQKLEAGKKGKWKFSIKVLN